MAEIMDGEFDFIDGTITVLLAPEITLTRLRTLERLLTQGVNKSPEEVIKAIEKEVPDLAAALRTLIPSKASKGLEYFKVALAIASLAIAIKTMGVNEQPRTFPKAEIEQIVLNFINSEQSHSQSKPPQEPPVLPGQP